MVDNNNVKKILAFWFGKPEDKDYGKPRKFWFMKDDLIDQQIRSQFLSIYEQAVTEKLDEWKNTPFSCLALILVLDQLPRNMFRNSPQSFATDNHGLKIAQYAVSQHFDRQLLPVQRWFIYLPYEHSENLIHQQQAITLFSTLQDDPDSQSAIKFATRHYQIIKRFGRFPHRNKILGRISTPEEIDFLKKPGSSF
ncbi:DUF924 family protein [Crocosphaera chwakensis]|uniref:DUF924 domain-containing protein n=1 Tax=Crocosphaera chwakensis CCY0110 TaxID=391612 RepID=A3IY17_9CHRO|nr:DUF924 family protein [Crocosphaera chwakensis]EAZ88645.1 hypothetical protein CY0110_12532 [Crocosphaera chwakensis CCY0110]